jgi:hypothetical protein
MRKRLVIISFALVLASISFAKNKKQEVDPIMPEVTERGRALFEYDQAAWHATDALQAEHPRAESLGRYIAHKSDAGWEVAFGHLDDAHAKFLIAYKATQGATLQDFTVTKVDPPQEDTSFYLAAAKAIDTALHDFQAERRPYNAAIVSQPSHQLYVYIVPAQTENGVYPLGGDARYLISADGSTIVEKRQLHKSIIENRGALPTGAKAVFGYHTHILSNVPEDTDVFYVLTRKPSMPELVGTGKHEGFEISTTGNITKHNW